MRKNGRKLFHLILFPVLAVQALPAVVFDFGILFLKIDCRVCNGDKYTLPEVKTFPGKHKDKPVDQFNPR